MVSWQTIVIALVFLFVLARCASVEKVRVKKKRDRGKGKNPLKDRETLHQLCQRNGSGNSRKNILELQAFFDLTKVRTIKKTVNLFCAKSDLTISVFCINIMKLSCFQFFLFLLNVFSRLPAWRWKRVQGFPFALWKIPQIWSTQVSTTVLCGICSSMDYR